MGAIISISARSENSNGPEVVGSKSILLALCRIGDQVFAIPASAILRILRMPELTPVPDAKHDVAGLLSIQGVIWPVVDPRPRMGIATGQADPAQRVVLVSAANDYGLWVDAVDGIEPVSELQVGETVGEANRAVCTAIAHIDGAIVPVISIESLDPGPVVRERADRFHD